MEQPRPAEWEEVSRERVGAEVLGAGRAVAVVGATCTTWGGNARQRGESGVKRGDSGGRGNESRSIAAC